MIDFEYELRYAIIQNISGITYIILITLCFSEVNQFDFLQSIEMDFTYWQLITSIIEVQFNIKMQLGK